MFPAGILDYDPYSTSVVVRTSSHMMTQNDGKERRGKERREEKRRKEKRKEKKGK